MREQQILHMRHSCTGVAHFLLWSVIVVLLDQEGQAHYAVLTDSASLLLSRARRTLSTYACSGFAVCLYDTCLSIGKEPQICRKKLELCRNRKSAVQTLIIL